MKGARSSPASSLTAATSCRIHNAFGTEAPVKSLGTQELGIPVQCVVCVAMEATERQIGIPAHWTILASCLGFRSGLKSFELRAPSYMCERAATEGANLGFNLATRLCKLCGAVQELHRTFVIQLLSPLSTGAPC